MISLNAEPPTSAAVALEGGAKGYSPGMRIVALGWIFLSLLTGAAAAEARANAPFRIEVRSSVDDRWDGLRKTAPIEHGKRYFIASMLQADSEGKLTAPVDERALLDEVRHALDSHGFRSIDDGEIPDVVLTVLFGRGFLKNPYLGDMADNTSEDIMVSTITTPKQAAAQRQHGFEVKLQQAQAEKLFIAIRAWKYPSQKKEKPVRLWQTTMIVEGPERTDLNKVSKDMLRAGASYFDRVMGQEAVSVSSSDPEGQVTLAPLQVLDTKEPLPAPAKKE